MGDYNNNNNNNVNDQPFNSQKGDFFFIILRHNQCFAQMFSLIGSVSQVSNAAHGPLNNFLFRTIY